MAKRPAGTNRTKAPKSRKSAKKPNTTGLIPFKKGERRIGRQKGTKNKFGVKLKEAILEAAEQSGRDGKGKDGAVGYLVWLSRAEPAVFGRMLEKVMPLQVEVADKTDRTMNAAEAIEKLEARGLPVPPALRSLAEGVAFAVHERQEADYDAELNGEGYEGADEIDPDATPTDDSADSDIDDAA
jgi:hypothetical protein